MVHWASQALTPVVGHFLLGDFLDRVGEDETALSPVAVASCTTGTKVHLITVWGLAESH